MSPNHEYSHRCLTSHHFKTNQTVLCVLWVRYIQYVWKSYCVSSQVGKNNLVLTFDLRCLSFFTTESKFGKGGGGRCQVLCLGCFFKEILCSPGAHNQRGGGSDREKQDVTSHVSLPATESVTHLVFLSHRHWHLMLAPRPSPITANHSFSKRESTKRGSELTQCVAVI